MPLIQCAIRIGLLNRHAFLIKRGLYVCTDALDIDRLAELVHLYDNGLLDNYCTVLVLNMFNVSRETFYNVG